MPSTIEPLTIEMFLSGLPQTVTVESFQFREDGIQKSLQNMIEVSARGTRHSTAYTDKIKSFEIIGESMADYILSYPVPYSVKRKVAEVFVEWLKNIIDLNQDIKEDVEIPEELTAYLKERDSVVAALKLLQSRDGVTKEDIAERLGVTERAVRNILRSISPDLYAEETEDKSTARIAGCDVTSKIVETKKAGSRKTYFKTINSVHPLILSENVLQVYTLIFSLADSYYEAGRVASLSIAVDVWCQLTDYGKDRVRFLSQDNENAKDFIAEIEDAVSKLDFPRFATEREMFRKYDASSTEEALDFLVKASNRTCRIVLKDGRKWDACHVRFDGAKYEIIGKSKVVEALFKREEVVKCEICDL